MTTRIGPLVFAAGAFGVMFSQCQVASGQVLKLIDTLNAKSEDCRHDENSVRHDDGTYRFTYESWIKGRNHDFLFGRCVFNEGNRDMYVDWIGPGVKGYAKPNRYIHSSFPAPSSHYDDVGSELVYGTGRKTIFTTYKRSPHEPSPAKGTPDLVSKITMSIPRNVETLEAGLVDLDLTFVAGVFRLPGKRGYLYQYSWVDTVADRRAEEGDTVSFRWDGEQSGRLMGHLRANEMIQDPRTGFRLNRERSGVYFTRVEPPIYQLLPVQLHNTKNEVGGSAVMAVYVPREN